MKLRLGKIPPKRVFWTLSKCEAGNIVVGMTEKGEICRTAFLRASTLSSVLAEWEKDWLGTEFIRKATLVVNSDAPRYLVGTDFQCAVWREIALIPKGHTSTYGEIAKRIANPGAVRAVGSACGLNPVPYFVPCHRVVGITGLGGFTGGLALKRQLLKSEGL